MIAPPTSVAKLSCDQNKQDVPVYTLHLIARVFALLTGIGRLPLHSDTLHGCMRLRRVFPTVFARVKEAAGAEEARHEDGAARKVIGKAAVPLQDRVSPAVMIWGFGVLHAGRSTRAREQPRHLHACCAFFCFSQGQQGGHLCTAQGCGFLGCSILKFCLSAVPMSENMLLHD